MYILYDFLAANKIFIELIRCGYMAWSLWFSTLGLRETAEINKRTMR